MMRFSEKHSQKKLYWILLNNKEKMHTAIIQNKDTNKHTKKPHFSLASNVFQCCGRCLPATPFTAVLACALVQHLGDITSVSLGIPQFYDNLLLLLTLGQKLSDYQLLVNLLPQLVGACSLQVFTSNEVCTITETNVNVMRS